MKKAVAVTVILAGTFATGCSDSKTAGSAGTPPPPAPTTQAKSLILPFDRYELTQSEYNMEQNATDILVQKCMRGKGLEWDVIKRPMNVEDLANRRRYSVIEIKVAQAYGYHAPIELRDPDGTKRADERRLQRLTAAQQRAAIGEGSSSSSSTCTAWAAKELKEPSVDYSLFNKLSPKYLKQSQNNPDVASALNAWSKCMGKHGHAYGNPFNAINDTKWWKDDARQVGTRDEVETAVQDVKCKRETGLIGKWYAAEKKMEEAAIKQNAEYFRSLTAAKSAHLRAVKKVLAG